MMLAPVKLLIVGYGLAGVVAAMLSARSGSILLPALALWFGGPVAVLLLATLPGVRRHFRSDESGEDALHAEVCAALDSFEADRRAEAARRASRAAG
jgi:hypothetical protein